MLDRNIEKILSLVQRTPSFRRQPHSDAPDLQAHARVDREAAAQGMVLLRNEGVLPLKPGVKLALFGNTSYGMITGGTGSGDVNEAYSISLQQGLKDAGLVADAALAEAYVTYIKEEEAKRPEPPMPFMPKPPIGERLVPADEIARLSRDADLALVTIGRRSGEFRDRQLEGDFELTAVEKKLLADVAAAFRAQKKKLLVVLNVGGVIETVSWRDNADAILLAWQPGQEAGHAIADVLTGRTAPSGKLATTFPVRWQDVPSSANFPGKVLLGPDPNARDFMSGDRAAEVAYEDDIWVGYRHFATKGVKTAYPFGFGLSYTRFDYSDLKLSQTEFTGGLTASVTITNTGAAEGREVVQLYLSAPGKTLPKPALELRAFAKTKLLRARRIATTQLHAGASRSRLVRIRELLLGRGSGDVRRQDRCFLGGHPPDGRLHEGPGREGRHGLDGGRGHGSELARTDSCARGADRPPRGTVPPPLSRPSQPVVSGGPCLGPWSGRERRGARARAFRRRRRATGRSGRRRARGRRRSRRRTRR